MKMDRTNTEATLVRLISSLDLGMERLEGEENVVLIISTQDRFIDIDIDKNDEITLRYEIGKGKDYKTIWKNRKVEVGEMNNILLSFKESETTDIYK